MSTATGTNGNGGEEPVEYWEDRLEDLGSSLEEHFEEFEGDIELSKYSIRPIGNGDYVLSTPGKVFYLGEDPVRNPELDVHERGTSKEGYNEYDEKLEDLIEEELSG